MREIEREKGRKRNRNRERKTVMERNRERGTEAFNSLTFYSTLITVSFIYYLSYYFQIVNFHGTHGEMFLYPKWVSLISLKIRERCDLVSSSN